MTEPSEATLDGPPLDGPSKNLSVKRLEGKDLEGRTFLITLSPKGDLSESSRNHFDNWARKNAQSVSAVIESGKSGQKHLHAALCFEKPRPRRGLTDYLWRHIVKPHHEDSRCAVAVVVTQQYNHDWYDKYLSKEVDAEVLVDGYNRALVESMFPTQEQQEHLQALKGKRCADAEFNAHEERLKEYHKGPVSFSVCLRYLRHRMFIERDMMVIKDERRVHQLAMALYRYVTHDIEESAGDREYIARHNPGELDFGIYSSAPVGNPGNSRRFN